MAYDDEHARRSRSWWKHPIPGAKLRKRNRSAMIAAAFRRNCRNNCGGSGRADNDRRSVPDERTTDGYDQCESGSAATPVAQQPVIVSNQRSSNSRP